LDLARIAQARNERGLTQEQLAEQLGVSQQALAHYEVGRIGVASAMLPKLAELLDLSFDELLVGQPSIRVPGKRGPASRLEQQIARVSQLPKAQQKFVMQMLDTVLAQHANG